VLSPQTFTKDWLDAHAKAAGAVNAQIFERCVHALELVERLSQAGLDFIFKGGTSLILHLEPVRRLSVDVDIACLEPLERVGRQGLNNHLLNLEFTFPRAQVAASRAALVASAIRAGKLEASLADFRKIPSDPEVLKTLRIDGPRNKLHKLRKTNIEAFYYWHRAIRLGQPNPA